MCSEALIIQEFVLVIVTKTKQHKTGPFPPKIDLVREYEWENMSRYSHRVDKIKLLFTLFLLSSPSCIPVTGSREILVEKVKGHLSCVP